MNHDCNDGFHVLITIGWSSTAILVGTGLIYYVLELIAAT